MQEEKSISEVEDIEYIEEIPNQPSEKTANCSDSVSDYLGKYMCNDCDYKALKLHNEAVHKGIRYPCYHCDYKATQKSSLNRHLKRHTQHL